jgi:hypothetical protein
MPFRRQAAVTTRDCQPRSPSCRWPRRSLYKFRSTKTNLTYAEPEDFTSTQPDRTVRSPQSFSGMIAVGRLPDSCYLTGWTPLKAPDEQCRAHHCRQRRAVLTSLWVTIVYLAHWRSACGHRDEFSPPGSRDVNGMACPGGPTKSVQSRRILWAGISYRNAGFPDSDLGFSLNGKTEFATG